MTIQKIKSLKEKSNVDTISGMIENVYERHASQPGTDRKWSMQNLILKDSTGTVKVLLSDRKECPQNMVGKQISFSSVDGESGPKGVYVKDDQYKGKTTRVVTVTEVAIVKVATTPDNQSSNQVTPAPKKMVLGATVGMATNNAVNIILSQGTGLTMEYFVGDDFIYDLHAVAGSIIHVSAALESGEELKRPQEPLMHQEATKQNDISPESDGTFLDGADADTGPF